MRLSKQLSKPYIGGDYGGIWVLQGEYIYAKN